MFLSHGETEYNGRSIAHLVWSRKKDRVERETEGQRDTKGERRVEDEEMERKTRKREVERSVRETERRKAFRKKKRNVLSKQLKEKEGKRRERGRW